VPIEVREKFDSRRLTKGQNPSAELAFIVLGTDDAIAARDALEDGSDETFAGLPRQSISVEPIGPELWDGTVRYGQSSGGGVTPGGEAVYSFDTGGGTQHITQSRATVHRYPAPGVGAAPDFKGAVGVSADGVEGVDITVPVFNFTETHYKPDDDITGPYKGILFNLTGKVNSDSFKGFAPGEVLFLGASGSKRTQLGEDADWEITYRFAASPNVSGLAIGPINGISKKGWEYLWVRYADQEDTAAKAIVKRPIAAYIERVYDDGGFAALDLE